VSPSRRAFLRAGAVATGVLAAGCTWSPDGTWLFVNVQRPGATYAITGPWGRGPL
jgi:secreted PhoX family phosphatase